VAGTVTTAALRRLAALAPTLLVVSTVAFLITHALPGDPAAVMLGAEATPAQIAALRAELDLDRPLGQRYLAWLGEVARGDLGMSIHHDRPVGALLLERIVPTLQLALSALVIAVAVGVPAGILASRRPGSALDRTITLLATSATAMAGFFLAMLLILLFAVHLQWLPAGGYLPLRTDPSGHVQRLVLPALALGLPLAGVPARVLRGTLLDHVGADHIVTATAKGLPRSSVLLRHELRLALVPTATVLGSSFADLLGGAVIVETVCNLPGLGQLLATSIGQRDLLVIQGVIVAVASVHVIITLAVDLLISGLDPRVDHVRF
jgi:peptide/nickel transport system permease protein